jgi:hypothetical protein
MSAIPVLPTGIDTSAVNIVNADASALKTILTTTGTFWDVISLSVVSDDTSDRLLQFYLTISGTDYLIGTVNIPTLSGTTATAASINVLSNLNLQAPVYDLVSNRILRLNTGISLKVKSTTTVTSTKTVTIVATSIKN